VWDWQTTAAWGIVPTAVPRSMRTSVIELK
jgi:hypothetical protein